MDGVRICNACYSRNRRKTIKDTKIAAEALQQLHDGPTGTSETRPCGSNSRSTAEVRHETLAPSLTDRMLGLFRSTGHINVPSTPPPMAGAQDRPTMADIIRDTSRGMDSGEAGRLSNASTPDQQDHRQHGTLLSISAHLLLRRPFITSLVGCVQDTLQSIPPRRPSGLQEWSSRSFYSHASRAERHLLFQRRSLREIANSHP